MNRLPRYPIYVPSKGRTDKKALTCALLRRSGIPFSLVVEPQELEAYERVFGAECILTLPENNKGLAYARTWIKKHAQRAGHFMHWQFDDDIKQLRRWYKGKRVPAPAPAILAACEDFVDRYENIGAAGIRHQAFADKTRPFLVNKFVYCVNLIRSDLPYQWRTDRDDVDFSLQVLSGGWNTILFNSFFHEAPTTGTNVGGCEASCYRKSDGKIKSIRQLQRLWPALDIHVKRSAGYPQQSLGHIWRRFKTPLKRRPSVDLDTIKPNAYGMKLMMVTQ